MRYIHEHKEWPQLLWNHEVVATRLGEVRHKQGRLIGLMESLAQPSRQAASLETLTQEIVKSNEIEDDTLDWQTVRSSLARRLGVDIGALLPADRKVDGVVEMTLDAVTHYDRELTRERLFGWHASLFPTGYSGLEKITIGSWRDDSNGPMRVVSGPIGRERVHFEAPEAARLDVEVAAFLRWFAEDSSIDPVLKAALAHLWFVTIHPFSDGNGRIARAIADMALARSERSTQRFYSMSAHIRVQRNTYYEVLERIQKGSMDVTEWIVWFLDCLERAIGGAEVVLATVLQKAEFWKRHSQEGFNDRQRSMLNRLPDGFEGKLTTSKWAKLTKSSQDTALRDIADLVERGVLIKDAASGRSTSYSLLGDHGTAAG